LLARKVGTSLFFDDGYDSFPLSDLKQVPRREREVYKDPRSSIVDKRHGTPWVGISEGEIAELEKVGYVMSGQRRRPLFEPKSTDPSEEVGSLALSQRQTACNI